MILIICTIIIITIRIIIIIIKKKIGCNPDCSRGMNNICKLLCEIWVMSFGFRA